MVSALHLLSPLRRLTVHCKVVQAAHGLSTNQRNCVVYRAGQKRIARQALIRARAAVADQMAHLQRLEASMPR